MCSLRNTKETYLEAVRILLLLLDNILTHPSEAKFRSIRVENKTIKERLLSLEGGNELLCAIGFQRSTDQYTLPTNCSMEIVREYRDALRKRRDFWANKKEKEENGKSRLI